MGLGVGVPADWTVPSDRHQVAKIPLIALSATGWHVPTMALGDPSAASTCDDGLSGGSTPSGSPSSRSVDFKGCDRLPATPPAQVTAKRKKWKAPRVPHGFAVTFENFDAVRHKDFEFLTS